MAERLEAQKLEAENSLSFLHVVRADIDLPDDVDFYDDRVYATACASFESLRTAAILQDSAPALYIYTYTA